jgi:type III secretion protein J
MHRHGAKAPRILGMKALHYKFWRLGVLAIGWLVMGCAAPVAAGLDEADANRIVVALDRASIDASKEGDPAVEGKFRVLVARDDVARALGAMRDEELPRAKPSSVLDAIGKGALVPSQTAEHAQLVAGMAGDLERTLQGIDGVVFARVHLNLPAPNPLGEAKGAHASASVLVEHRGSVPPLSNDAVQRLVAGGVAGLAPSDVNVVTVSRAAPPASGASPIAHVGPIAVARGSMRVLQGALVALVALVALLAAATLVLYSRLARARADLASRPAPQAASRAHA